MKKRKQTGESAEGWGGGGGPGGDKEGKRTRSDL